MRSLSLRHAAQPVGEWELEQGTWEPSSRDHSMLRVVQSGLIGTMASTCHQRTLRCSAVQERCEFGQFAAFAALLRCQEQWDLAQAHARCSAMQSGAVGAAHKLLIMLHASEQ